MLGAAAYLIDAANIPLAAEHGVVSAILVDPGAQAGRAHGECDESIGLRRQLVRQLGPQILYQLAHRLGDGFDVFEVENLPMDAFDLGRVDGPAIEDARLVARFFLVIAADPAPDAVAALRAQTRTPRGSVPGGDRETALTFVAREARDKARTAPKLDGLPVRVLDSFSHGLLVVVAVDHVRRP